ncbi:MAG: hypothetical protein U1F71_24290 [Verrucomicrobiaceae bacterium]
MPLHESSSARRVCHTCVLLAMLCTFLASCTTHDVPALTRQEPVKHIAHECKVAARTLCNDTGITLRQGADYRFEVSGRWTDWFVGCDEAGPRCPLLNLLMCPLRPGLRFSPMHDRRANFFSLVGHIGPYDGKKLPQDAFLVRDGMRFHAPRTGRLFVFANDYISAYGNNEGELTLTVIKE